MRRVLLALTFLGAWFTCGGAQAQVVTCDGAALGSLYGDCGAPGVANAPPAAKVPVLYCDQPASIGSAQTQCPSAKWIPFDNTQAGSKLLTSYAGWQALSKITYVVVIPPPPPPTQVVVYQLNGSPLEIIQGQAFGLTWSTSSTVPCKGSWTDATIPPLGTAVLFPNISSPIDAYDVQITCGATTATYREVVTQFDRVLPLCKPFSGVGQRYKLFDEAGAQRYFIGWYCKGKFQYAWYALADPVSEAPIDALAYFINLTDAQFLAEWAKPKRIFTAGEKAQRDDFLLTRPADPVWLVAKNGASLTRPTYPFFNKARGTSVTGRVAVGDRCDCRLLNVDGSTVYCSVAGRDNTDTPAVDVLPMATVTACTASP